MNIFKYADQKWSTPTSVADEVLTINGHYTGEHLGTPMQDAKDAVVSADPHYVAHHTDHYGTITQDADSDANMPTKSALTVTKTLTGCTLVGDQATVAGTDFVAIAVADPGYKLPATVTITNSDSPLTVETDYSWDQKTGNLAIQGAKISGNLKITITATEG